MSIASEITRLQVAKSDLKNAIEAKGITVDNDSTLDDYADLVTSISSDGDRKDLCNPKDVDFVDYDGRLLYSYTVDEFAELTDLPPNPTNIGLVAQGWNWTLEDAQPFVAEYGGLVIGQNYTTDTGKTRIYLSIDNNDYIKANMTMPLWFHVHAVGSCIINWGDGSAETITNTTTGNKSINHKYIAIGDYIIEIEVLSGAIRLGYYGANQTIVGTDMRNKHLVRKVEIGDGVIGLCRNTFDNFVNLKSVSIPITCINHDTGSDYAMFHGHSLTCVVFPSGTKGQNTKIIGNGGNICVHLKYISIPKSMNGFKITAQYPRSLRKLIFYEYTISTILDVYLYDTSYCTHFIIPGTYTSIPPDRCRSSLIRKLIIPESVTSIGAAAFSYNGWLTEVHLRPTTPPTLNNVNAFSSGPSNRIYYVPYSEDHSILEAYQNATNWSTYASQMQEEDPT